MLERDVAMSLKSVHAGMVSIMQQKINEYDLRIGLLHLAIMVKKYPEKSQKELAKEMKFTEGAMSQSVKRLIKENILEQIPLERDMRYNRLVVTPKGETLINDYEEYLVKVYEDLFIGFKEEELVLFDNYLKKVRNNMNIIIEKNIEK